MAIFGRKPIQLTWASLIFVSLVLCYCGQGAVRLHVLRAHVCACSSWPSLAQVLLDPAFLPELQRNPFFALAPNAWIRSALVAVSTGATLIASQSVVSGAFAVVDEACVFFLVMMISRCPVLTMACRVRIFVAFVYVVVCVQLTDARAYRLRSGCVRAWRWCARRTRSTARFTCRRSTRFWALVAWRSWGCFGARRRWLPVSRVVVVAFFWFACLDAWRGSLWACCVRCDASGHVDAHPGAAHGVSGDGHRDWMN